jgi:hypothetical protein
LRNGRWDVEMLTHFFQKLFAGEIFVVLPATNGKFDTEHLVIVESQAAD